MLRLATAGDADAIDRLMKTSIRDLFPAFYDARQTESSIEHVGAVDRMLIDDATYFVVAEDSEIIACGGWSRRDKLYTGSGPGESDARLLDPATEAAHVRAMFVRGDRTRRGLGTQILEACRSAAREQGFRQLNLLATLPGVLLYEHFGFRPTGRSIVMLPDGVELACVAMEMSIEDPAPA